MLGLLGGWIALGLALDLGAYALQRRYLAQAVADAKARADGCQRAWQRLVERVGDAVLAVLAVVLVGAGGLAAGTPSAWQAVSYLALMITLDQTLRALLSVATRAPAGMRAAFIAQFKRVAQPLALGLVLWGVYGAVPSGWGAEFWPLAWAGSWLVLAGAWRVYRGRSQVRPLLGRPLGDGPLQARLHALARTCGRPQCAITVADDPPLATQVGARVEAAGRGGQIVLTQALVARLTPSAVVAVVAHEFGHACLGHLWRFDVMRALLVALYIFGLATAVLAINPQVFAPALLWLIYVTLAPVAWVVRPALNGYRRGCEFAADAFAARHVGPSLLADTLADLFSVNPHRAGLHPWYCRLNATHPPDQARLERLRMPPESDCSF